MSAADFDYFETLKIEHENEPNYWADEQARIEADAWAEMDAAIQEGYLTRQEGEEAFYKWFRLGRGMPSA